MIDYIQPRNDYMTKATNKVYRVTIAHPELPEDFFGGVLWQDYVVTTSSPSRARMLAIKRDKEVSEMSKEEGAEWKSSNIRVNQLRSGRRSLVAKSDLPILENALANNEEVVIESYHTGL